MSFPLAWLFNLGKQPWHSILVRYYETYSNNRYYQSVIFLRHSLSREKNKNQTKTKNPPKHLLLCQSSGALNCDSALFCCWDSVKTFFWKWNNWTVRPSIPPVLMLLIQCHNEREKYRTEVLSGLRQLSRQVFLFFSLNVSFGSHYFKNLS